MLFRSFSFLPNFTTNWVNLICFGLIKLYRGWMEHWRRGRGPVPTESRCVWMGVSLFWGGGGWESLPACHSLINDSVWNISIKSAFIRDRSLFSSAISIAIYWTAPRLNKSIPKCTWPIQARLVKMRQRQVLIMHLMITAALRYLWSSVLFYSHTHAHTHSCSFEAFWTIVPLWHFLLSEHNRCRARCRCYQCC